MRCILICNFLASKLHIRMSHDLTSVYLNTAVLMYKVICGNPPVNLKIFKYVSDVYIILEEQQI